MKKAIVVSILMLTAGASFAAVEASRQSALLTGGTVLNPFTLQVVSATRFTAPTGTAGLPSDGRITPITPIGDPGEGGGNDVRPGPFTPPPRSPYAPPPR